MREEMNEDKNIINKDRKLKIRKLLKTILLSLLFVTAK